MKREFLNNLGLEADVINQIMAEHGKTIQVVNENHKTEVDNLTTEVTALKAETSQLQTEATNATKYQEQLVEAQKQAETAQTELKQAKVERALIEAGANDLEYAKFKLGDVDLDGLDDAIGNLKESLPNQFAKTEDIPNYKPVNNGKLEPAKDKTVLSREDILAIEDTAVRQEEIRKNINLFKGE